MLANLIRGVIGAIIVVAVSEVSDRRPRLGAFLLTLPIVAILAFIFTWTRYRDLATISNLSRETLILVPLGLPFFVPPAFADKLGIGFWPAFVVGVALASITIGLWFSFGPQRL